MNKACPSIHALARLPNARPKAFRADQGMWHGHGKEVKSESENENIIFFFFLSLVQGSRGPWCFSAGPALIGVEGAEFQQRRGRVCGPVAVLYRIVCMLVPKTKHNTSICTWTCCSLNYRAGGQQEAQAAANSREKDGRDDARPTHSMGLLARALNCTNTYIQHSVTVLDKYEGDQSSITRSSEAKALFLLVSSLPFASAEKSPRRARCETTDAPLALAASALSIEQYLTLQ